MKLKEQVPDPLGDGEKNHIYTYIVMLIFKTLYKYYKDWYISIIRSLIDKLIFTVVTTHTFDIGRLTYIYKSTVIVCY